MNNQKTKKSPKINEKLSTRIIFHVIFIIFMSFFIKKLVGFHSFYIGEYNKTNFMY